MSEYLLYKIWVVIIGLLINNYTFSQNSEIPIEQIESYFQEVKLNTEKHQDVWDIDLYGPILIVNPYNRKTYANFPDASGI